MDDHRVWAFEESLWTGDAAHYRDAVDDECLMVLPADPFVMTGKQAIEAVSATPRWSKVVLSEQQIMLTGRTDRRRVQGCRNQGPEFGLRSLLHIDLSAPVA